MFTEKVLTQFSRIVRYKMNIQESVVFLLAYDEQSKNETMKIPFTSTKKKENI
jgi:hypothetical protein